MKNRTIYDYINKNVTNNNLPRAIRALRNIVIDKKFADKVKIAERNFKEVKDKELKNTQEGRLLTQAYNRISDRILSLAYVIPDDLNILKSRITHGLNGSKLENSFLLLKEYLNTKSENEVNHYIEKLNSAQESHLSDYEEGDLNSLIEQFDNIKEDFKEYLDILTLEDFKENFAEIMWDNLLNDNTFFYKPYIPRIVSNSIIFYNDIMGINNNQIKPLLLLWEEEYLAGNYRESLQFINRVRIEFVYDREIVFEYTALSYLDTIGASKIINGAITGNNDSSYRKLLIYVERAINSDTKKSQTYTKSMEYIFDKLLIAISKVYHNINFDYVFNNATRGQSKKRNITKKCIEITVCIVKLFKLFKLEEQEFIYRIITELDGGGKYDWLSIKKKKIVNRTTFYALEHKKTLLDYIKSEKGNFEKSANNLLAALKEKYKRIIEIDQRNEKFLFACEIGYFLYKKNEFLELQKDYTLKRDVYTIPIMSYDPVNNIHLFEKKKIKEILNRYEKEKPIYKEYDKTVDTKLENKSEDILAKELFPIIKENQKYVVKELFPSREKTMLEKKNNFFSSEIIFGLFFFIFLLVVILVYLQLSPIF